MKLQILAACAALATLTAGQAFAADAITAKLSAPVAEKTKFIAGGAMFNCEGDTCIAMATMNVSLPAAMKEWVENQTQTGRYGNVSDYVRDLIRRDQERADKIAAMQRLIDEGRASGVSEEGLDEILVEARRQARARRGP